MGQNEEEAQKFDMIKKNSWLQGAGKYRNEQFHARLLP